MTTRYYTRARLYSVFDISPSFLSRFWRFWALWICTFQDKVNGYKITALTDTRKNFFSNRFLSSYPWSLDFAVRDRERTGQKLIIEPQILAFYCYTNDFWGPNSTTTTFYTGRSHDTGHVRNGEMRISFFRPNILKASFDSVPYVSAATFYVLGIDKCSINTTISLASGVVVGCSYYWCLQNVIFDIQSPQNYNVFLPFFESSSLLGHYSTIIIGVWK